MNRNLQLPQEPGDSPRPITILLVDDHLDIRDLIAESLRRSGYRVLVAGLPSEALRLAREQAEPPDLLLSDVAMPEMWGPDLARAVGGIFPSMKVLFMSGYGEVIDSAGTSTGVKEWQLLEKPFSLKALETRIAELMATRPT